MAETKSSGRGRGNKSGANKEVDTGIDATVAGRPTVDSVDAFDESRVERALVTGEESGLLEDLFGEREYAELRRLARDASAQSTRGGTRVLILPGIMGSKLGSENDEIWLDLIDIARGRLSRLRMDGEGAANIIPLGVMLIAYLKLKLRLRIAGFNASFWPYDWRKSVVETGALLAKSIKADADEVHLVAHSMGGLVARASLAHKVANLGRIITLGTPNYGSFSPLQAFRGTHSIVHYLSRIDHGLNDLPAIFGGFPGLSEMFPMPGKMPIDLFDLGNWPAAGPRPAQELLTKAHDVQSALPTGKDAEKGIIQIIGINKETVVGATIKDGEFVYVLSDDGDGTVPLVCATLADAAGTYFIEEEHGSLPNNAQVARAVQSIIATGKTTELKTEFSQRRSGPTGTVAERDLTSQLDDGAGGRRLSVREQRFLLADFASPTSSDAADAGGITIAQVAPDANEPAFADRIVITRESIRHLEIVLAQGSLTEVSADAYVLGIFKNVNIGGAALAVNQLLDGGVEQALNRRMFNCNVGEISILPKGRHAVRADFVAFAGLGPIDSFQENTLETVGENLIRTFVTAHVSDFATVLMGGASGILPKSGLMKLLSGFTRGLKDADNDRLFHRVTICELDPLRYNQLTRDMYELCGGNLFDGIEVTLQTRKLPPPPVPATAARAAGVGTEPIYLLVRQIEDDRDSPGLQASVLTKGSKAAIHRAWKPLDEAALSNKLSVLLNGVPPASQMADFGEKLAQLVLPDTILNVLDQFKTDHVVVVHDAGASRIPWETLFVRGRSLALTGGMSHRYEADDLSVAKWLEGRQQNQILRVLLIVNPTKDLVGAQKEGDRVEKLLKGKGLAQVRRLDGDEARRMELLRCFQSGDFDVVHYAGHAFFDPNAPSRSGILCAGREVLAGADLAGLSNLPSLVFFNACEVARIRRLSDEPSRPEAPVAMRRSIGFAEAFLRGGVANFVGTYWPVGDAAAEIFAPAFYENLLAGRPLSEALLTSRRALQAKDLGDWADYILYGDPDFILKRV
ncbi:CHAT domain-containing protein [Rhizobium leguminosarum]|uniref:CHAT domain-containing protein n=1 Tax=Rhizobium leguminosarum TaxID=384 RepID=UPI0014421A9A|nr:CHAT domain-containing protein [Rhizobium leguminosarum]NKK96934.1 CHAT domain-containing protein [Rhizobium leguminosarum bv. viciae]NKL75345.1 CHAT domain-containing protein [Rhizobium leguminosarum bv. viciae]